MDQQVAEVAAAAVVEVVVAVAALVVGDRSVTCHNHLVPVLIKKMETKMC